MNARHVFRSSTLLLAGWLGSGAAVGVGADGPRKNFVSCPIVRDTASVPCWLSRAYDGELYYLTIQSDVTSPVTPPWLGHRVLVEGTVSAEPRICGGIVLKPVHPSVMPEPDASCNTMLPAEERYNLTFEPPRPPGPSKGRLAFDNAPPPARRRRPRSRRRRCSWRCTISTRSSELNHARVLTDVIQLAPTPLRSSTQAAHIPTSPHPEQRLETPHLVRRVCGADWKPPLLVGLCSSGQQLAHV